MRTRIHTFRSKCDLVLEIHFFFCWFICLFVSFITYVHCASIPYINARTRTHIRLHVNPSICHLAHGIQMETLQCIVNISIIDSVFFFSLGYFHPFLSYNYKCMSSFLSHCFVNMDKDMIECGMPESVAMK